MKAVIADMQAAARAHEQWAMSWESSTSEAGASTAFAAQIRRWISALELASKMDAVDPVGAAPCVSPSTREKGSS